MSNPQSRAHRKPPDVEEALSSMLWTPYDNNISESDSSDETEALHRVNNNSSNNSSFSFFGTGPNQDHRRHQQQSLMRRSLSAWSYRNRTGKSPRSPGEGDTVGNRFSYPYYDQPELGLALGGGFSGGWYDSSSITNNNSNTNYYYGINGSSYGYGLPVTSSRSSYTFHPDLAAAVGPADSRAPWQTLTVATEDRAIEKRPYLQQRQYQQLQTPFVGRWQNGAGTAQLETSSLPFSLLALDSPAAAAVGDVRRSATTATDGTTLVGPGGSEVDGFADSYQDDYQVRACTGQGENVPPGSDTDCNANSINSNIDATCSNSNNKNNNLCIISAMFLRPGDSGGGGGGVDGAGNLHFPSEPRPHWQGHGKSTAATPADAAAGAQHNPSITTTLLPLLAYGDGGGRVGAPDAASITRTPSCNSSAEGDERLTTGSGLLTCVRQANAATSTSVRRADDGFRGELDRVDQQQQNKASSPHRVPAMRLNVPAAGLAEGSRTSVYIPSTVADGVGVGGVGGSLLPALTIQVNRLDPNNQQQNDVVNNAASGVSIVSCYRAASATGGQAVVQMEDCGGRGEGDAPKCIRAPGGDRDRVLGVTVSKERAEEKKRTKIDDDLVADSGGVNTSDVNFSPEQMVQVSSVEERLHVAGDVGVNGSDGSANSVAHGASPHARTFTSTEAQTDDTIQQSQQLQQQQQHQQQQQFLLQHPASAAGFIGSSATGPEPPIMTTMLGPGSEFSTREHRRRERRERRQARNRLQHIHPLEPPGPAPGPGPSLLHRSPPPIEIIPDILHSHLPPPYTTLPMGASLIPQMIPANAVAAAAAAAAASAIPVRAADDCRYTFPIPIMRSSPSERSRKGCCGHWFAGPPLRALIAVVALGGVACALGGAALGATGLAGSPTSHLTAALLMIGVGVILVTVSGAAWRMTAPGAPPCLGLGSTVDLGRCSRRPCGRGGSTPHGLLYPEFQHRPPPPSYQASMQEYRLRLLLLDRDRQSGRMRSTASPPPTYRSNVGSLLRIPLSSRYNNGSSNSIFGGISGIISGAVGGGSSNSVNNVPQASHAADLQVNTNPYGTEGGHHGTLPPSYRSVNMQPSTPTPPPASVAETLHAPPSPGDANLISDDNTHPTMTGQTNNKPSATSATSQQQHPAPSIIKIDDRRRRSTGTDVQNSIPNVSLIDTGNEEPLSSVEASPSSSSRLCNATGGAGAATTAAAIPTANSGSKDLVTIVTISGTIEPSATGASRSVYTSSSNTNTPSEAAGGATCTLLNSNSSPLLATVIPVSKAGAQTTPSASTATRAPL